MCSIAVASMCLRFVSSAVLHQAEQSNVVALRRAAREDDFLGLCPEHVGNLLAGVIHGAPGRLAIDMRPAACVSKLRQVVGQHRLEHPWVHRRGRIVVEVDRLHDAKHLLPETVTTRDSHRLTGWKSIGRFWKSITDFQLDQCSPWGLNTCLRDNRSFRNQASPKTIEAVCEEIRELYLADSIPWVVGYSGGKDSSATLQLVWLAIAKLPAAERTKTIHVISTDTLVEQPVVARWVETSLNRMRTAAREQELPFQPHKLTPEVADSFWVNLIGRGYPAPNQKFRWCTERLKIKPSNKFIRGVVQQYGEAILVLGTRKAESQRRAANIQKHAGRRVRERLVPNASLPNSLVYTPIEDWNNDDVWLYLMQVKNPWGHDNKSLLGMYQGATDGGECPLVVDSSTPSCGTSRFGCWVCTVVDKDRSMEAMIKNDEEKVWMTPLLELQERAGRARSRQPRLSADERPRAAFPRQDRARPV